MASSLNFEGRKFKLTTNVKKKGKIMSTYVLFAMVNSQKRENDMKKKKKDTQVKISDKVYNACN